MRRSETRLIRVEGHSNIRRELRNNSTFEYFRGITNQENKTVVGTDRRIQSGFFENRENNGVFVGQEDPMKK